MAEVLSPNIVPAELNYYLTPAKGGDATWYPGTAGNFTRTHDVRPVKVTDIRQLDDKFTLDVHGFQIVQHTSAEKEFEETDHFKETYYAETAELLKKVTGATQVRPLSHIIRRTGWTDAVEKAKGLDAMSMLPGGVSGRYCHVDQSYKGATEVLGDNLTPEEYARLTKTRFGIYNVWRPINQVIRREPLAMCDARSVDDSDLYPIKLQFVREGSYKTITKGASYEAWGLAANDTHKWYYASELTPDEVVVFKNFDSKLDGRARRCPHTSFSSENDAGPPRESVELRCFVFWEDEPAE